MQERREMGQTALETTLNELKHVLLLPIFFAGQIIYDILTIVQSDVLYQCIFIVS